MWRLALVLDAPVAVPAPAHSVGETIRLTSPPREVVTSGSSAPPEDGAAFSSVAGTPTRSSGGSKLPFVSSRSGDEETRP
jgi:hypothetical protein